MWKVCEAGGRGAWGAWLGGGRRRPIVWVAGGRDLPRPVAARPPTPGALAHAHAGRGATRGRPDFVLAAATVSGRRGRPLIKSCFTSLIGAPPVPPTFPSCPAPKPSGSGGVGAAGGGLASAFLRQVAAFCTVAPLQSGRAGFWDAVLLVAGLQVSKKREREREERGRAGAGFPLSPLSDAPCLPPTHTLRFVTHTRSARSCWSCPGPCG